MHFLFISRPLYTILPNVTTSKYRTYQREAAIRTEKMDEPHYGVDVAGIILDSVIPHRKYLMTDVWLPNKAFTFLPQCSL